MRGLLLAAGLLLAGCGGTDSDPDAALSVYRCEAVEDCDGNGISDDARLCLNPTLAAAEEAEREDRCRDFWVTVEPPCQRLACRSICTDTGSECARPGREF